LFAYNRPDHANRALEALSRCRRRADCDFFLFSDGPRNEAAQPAVEQTSGRSRAGGNLWFILFPTWPGTADLTDREFTVERPILSNTMAWTLDKSTVCDRLKKARSL